MRPSCRRVRRRCRGHPHCGLSASSMSGERRRPRAESWRRGCRRQVSAHRVRKRGQPQGRNGPRAAPGSFRQKSLDQRRMIGPRRRSRRFSHRENTATQRTSPWCPASLARTVALATSQSFAWPSNSSRGQGLAVRRECDGEDVARVSVGIDPGCRHIVVTTDTSEDRQVKQ